MFTNRARIRTTAALFGVLALGIAGCSSSGGSQDTGGDDAGGSVANTPAYKVSIITHASAGDTFWDIIRKGAQAAADKDNIDIQYTNNDDATQQATLIQNAIDAKVDAIALTLPNTPALASAVKAAQDAGIPVVGFNAGYDDWKELGLLGYFGQDETTAGVAAGGRMLEDGAQKILCVIQTQGQVQLEDRCKGVAEGAAGASVENIYVNGVDSPSVQSTITAKLQQDPTIDHVMTLSAPIALIATQSLEESGSTAKIGTFDTNAELVDAIKSGSVEFAVDQQPYLQGYLAIDSLWLYKTNANTIGGGSAVNTGPAFVDSSNVDVVAQYAKGGTR